MTDPDPRPKSDHPGNAFNFNIFPPSNPFSTSSPSTPEARSLPTWPQQTTSPPKQSRKPRKGYFTEVLSPNDGPPAYTAALPHKDSVSPPTPPKDFPPHGMPRRPSRSVSPANRLPSTSSEINPGDQYMAGGRPSHDPFVDSARYEEPGFYGRRGYGRGGYRNPNNYRAANIISFVVFVVRGSTIKRALQFSTDFAHRYFCL